MLINFIKVSDAGTALANGLYKENDVQNGKPYYENDLNEIRWSLDDRWIIASKSGNVYYMSDSDVDTPDLAVYDMTGVGSLPYPTVEAVTYEEIISIKNAGNNIVNACYIITGVSGGKPSYYKQGIYPVQNGVSIEFVDGKSWDIYGEPNYEGGVVPQFYT